MRFGIGIDVRIFEKSRRFLSIPLVIDIVYAPLENCCNDRAPLGAAPTATARGAAAETPHFSSSILTRSATSITVKELRFSAIACKSAILALLPSVASFLVEPQDPDPAPPKPRNHLCSNALPLRLPPSSSSFIPPSSFIRPPSRTSLVSAAARRRSALAGLPVVRVEDPDELSPGRG